VERSFLISLTAVVASAALLSAPPATAKDFGPGDLKVCNHRRCVALTNPDVLRVWSTFIYGNRTPAPLPPLRRGAPSFELRFRNGYSVGAVASTRLDHFRSHGVICGRFRRGTWYRVPAAAVRDLRRMTAGLEPMPVGRAPRSC
jgi:hypothetical protein